MAPAPLGRFDGAASAVASSRCQTVCRGIWARGPYGSQYSPAENRSGQAGFQSPQRGRKACHWGSMMVAETYPVRAGSKVSYGTSKLASDSVDEGSERRLNVLTGILFAASVDPGLCADDMAALVGEGILYTRPRASELVALGLIRKAAPKPNTTTGRKSATLMPVSWIRLKLHAFKDNDDGRWRACRELIVRAMDRQREALIRK
jgi:hypothetical protein